MNDLIKVNYDGKFPTISGRELHKALEVKTPYTQWFDRMIEYGFAENKDFRLVSQKCETNNPKNPFTTIIDHHLTIPMSKELCMLQRNEKGKFFRQYFIKIEEAWNSPEMIMKRALEIADRNVEKLKQKMILPDFCFTKKKRGLLKRFLIIHIVKFRRILKWKTMVCRFLRMRNLGKYA